VGPVPVPGIEVVLFEMGKGILEVNGTVKETVPPEIFGLPLGSEAEPVGGVGVMLLV
jgi:hypothetical protein